MTDIFSTPGMPPEDIKANFPELHARYTDCAFATYAEDAEHGFLVLSRHLTLPPGVRLGYSVKDCWAAYNKEREELKNAPQDPGSLSGGAGDAPADPAWAKDLAEEEEINEACGAMGQVDPTEGYVAYCIEKAFDALNLRFDAYWDTHGALIPGAPLLDGYYRARVMDLAALMSTVPEHMRVEVARRLAELCKHLPSSDAATHARDCLAIDFWCDVAELYVETLTITAGRRVGRDSPPEVIAFARQVTASRNEMLKLTRSCRETRIRLAAGGVTRKEDTRAFPVPGQVPDALTRPTEVAPARRSLRDLDPTKDVLLVINGHLHIDCHPISTCEFPANFGHAIEYETDSLRVVPPKANAVARIDETRQQGHPTWHPLPGKRHVTRIGLVTSALWRATIGARTFLTDGHHSWLPDGRIIGSLIASDARQFEIAAAHFAFDGGPAHQTAPLAPYDLVAVYEGDVVREPMVKTLSGQPIDPPELEC